MRRDPTTASAGQLRLHRGLGVAVEFGSLWAYHFGSKFHLTLAQPQSLLVAWEPRIYIAMNRPMLAALDALLPTIRLS